MSIIVPDPVNPPLKQCARCKKFFPATTEHFHRHHTTIDRLRPQCKKCRSEIYKETQKKKRPDVVPEGYKQCGKCREIKAATVEFFSPAKRYSYGVASYCKECVNRNKREKNAAKATKRKMAEPVPQLGYKICNLCKQEFPATDYYFSVRKDLKDGLNARCKQCVNSLQNARSHAKNPRDIVPEGYRQCTGCKNCYPENTKYFTKYKKGSKGLHPLCKDCKNARDKQYRDTHKEQTRESIKRSEARHKDRAMARAKVKRDRRRAFLANVSGGYTTSQIEEQLKRQKYCCYYCHNKFRVNEGRHIYHIDHTFPLSRVDKGTPANDISYLVLACPGCNLKKGNKFPWEWLEGGRLC